MSSLGTQLKKQRHSVFKLLLIGLLFHLCYISAVFDCYFTSPVVHGMNYHALEGQPLAKRLVLVVGDGLRADLLLARNGFSMIPDAPEVVAPYLRSVIETRGAFGISHTRVPTESRPGHVAIIGGMYEDVSAVTRGWRTNPVHFDSVFNQSSHTFSFGSPDILPMFAQGATPGKVDTWCYHEDEEDFTKDATALDVWVLDQLRSLFHNATSDGDLDRKLKQDKTVFFLHLLGLDTTGHSYRPHSVEYMKNIQVVDAIVRQTEALFEEFYGDSNTTFIFTADHGMSKIGNHGDGDPDNTRTPLIAWGAGVRGPLPDSVPSSHDDYSAPFDLSHLLRHDVEQADIAALMSTLIGIPWPINSVGVLPDVDANRSGYIDSSNGEQLQAHASLVNAQTIVEHYRVKHELKKQHLLFYKPFSYFSNVEESPGTTELVEIQASIKQGKYSDARRASADLIKQALAGIRYLETYDRTLIRIIVIAAYLGWIAYSAVHVLPDGVVQPAGDKLWFDVVACIATVIFWSSFAFQHSPTTLYLYILFPIYFWRYALIHTLGPLQTLFNSGGLRASTLGRNVLQAIAVIAAMQSMVVAYTHRSVWSAGFVLIGLIWPISCWPKGMLSQNIGLLFSWVAACTGTAVFPLLSVNKQESIEMIMLGGLIMLCIGMLGVFQVASQRLHKSLEFGLMLQCALILTSMLITASSAANLRAKAGLPLSNQIAGWVVLALASILPLALHSRQLPPTYKILSLFLGFSVCFVILSISVEGLFYSMYCATLVVWTEVESTLQVYSRSQHAAGANGKDTGIKLRDQKSNNEPSHLRIAVFFLFFVQVAFFGTGNVASISSFYLEPVYRLVPIFNPFLMATLLLFKIIAPYVMLAIVFARLNARLHLPPFRLFLVALTLTDIMTMTFFFNVTDTGSWLEIGQTISFFCISSLLLVWSAGICALGELLMKENPPRGKVKLN